MQLTLIHENIENSNLCMYMFKEVYVIIMCTNHRITIICYIKGKFDIKTYCRAITEHKITFTEYKIIPMLCGPVYLIPNATNDIELSGN